MELINDVTPLQGWWDLWTPFTQGFTLGYHMTAFQAYGWRTR